MVTILLGFYKRKPGTTHEQFENHWRNVHGPMIRDLPGIEKYLLRYVQHSVEADPAYASSMQDYDGFSETWWTSDTARDELYKTDFYEKTIDDERMFLDMDKTRWICLDKQNTVIAGPVSVDESKVPK